MKEELPGNEQDQRLEDADDCTKEDGGGDESAFADRGNQCPPGDAAFHVLTQGDSTVDEDVHHYEHDEVSGKAQREAGGDLFSFAGGFF